MAGDPDSFDFPERPRVALIGAGLAGLAAARELRKHGLAVQVFEKARGVGGRTSRRSVGGFSFDLGAQYFTVRDSRFEGFAADCVRDGAAAEWRGVIAAVEDGAVRSTPEQIRFVGTPAMNALCKRLADGIPLALRTRIAKAERSKGAWYLRDDRGAVLGGFDGLVLSLPPEQCAGLLPEAGPLAEAVRRVPMNPCWAVIAGFLEAVGAPFDGAFVNDGPLGWVARNNSKPGRPEREAWVLHASAGWSAQHLDDPPAEVAHAILAAFRKLPGVEAPEPVLLDAHRWRYSLPPEPLALGALADPRAHLSVCGDWCGGGRVEGAYLSGLAAAAELCQFERCRGRTRA